MTLVTGILAIFIIVVLLLGMFTNIQIPEFVFALLLPTIFVVVLLLVASGLSRNADRNYEHHRQCAERGMVYEPRLDACIEGSYLP